MDQHATYLARAQETADQAARAHDPVVRRTLKDMEQIYRLLAELAAGPSDRADPEAFFEERESTPFDGALIDGSGHRH